MVAAQVLVTKRLSKRPRPPAGLARVGDHIVGVEQPITRLAMKDRTLLDREKAIAQKTLDQELASVARNRFELWDSGWYIVNEYTLGFNYPRLMRQVLVRTGSEERRLYEADDLDAQEIAERDHQR